MRIGFHINYNGRCREAFEFYQSVLGGEVEFLTYGNSPLVGNVPAEWNEKVVHGTFQLNGIKIAGADALPDQYVKQQGYHLLLQLESEAEVHHIFKELSQSGSITMPLQKTFWTSYYGIVTDRFGVSWEINYAVEA